MSSSSSPESLTMGSPPCSSWDLPPSPDDFRLSPGMLHELHIDQLETMEVDDPSFLDSTCPSTSEMNGLESCLSKPVPDFPAFRKNLTGSTEIQPTPSSGSCSNNTSTECSPKSREVWEISTLQDSSPETVSDMSSSKHIESVKTPSNLKMRFKKIQTGRTVKEISSTQDLVTTISLGRSPVVLLPSLNLSNLVNGTVKLRDPSLFDVQHITHRKNETYVKQSSTSRNDCEISKPKKYCRNPPEKSRKASSKKKRNVQKKLESTLHPRRKVDSSQCREIVANPDPTPDARNFGINTDISTPNLVVVKKIKSKTRKTGDNEDWNKSNKRRRKTGDDEDWNKSNKRRRRVLPPRQKKKNVTYYASSSSDDCSLNLKVLRPRDPRPDSGVLTDSSAPSVESKRKRGRPLKSCLAISPISSLEHPQHEPPEKPLEEPPTLPQYEPNEKAIESTPDVKEKESSPSKATMDTDIGTVIFLDSGGILPTDSYTGDPPSDPFEGVVESVRSLELGPPPEKLSGKHIQLLGPNVTRLDDSTESSKKGGENSASGLLSGSRHQNAVSSHIQSAVNSSLNISPGSNTVSSQHTPLYRDSLNDDLLKDSSDCSRSPTSPQQSDLDDHFLSYWSDDDSFSPSNIHSPGPFEDGYLSPCEDFQMSESHGYSLTTSNVIDPILDSQSMSGDFFTLRRDKEPPLSIPLNTEGDYVVASLIRDSIDEYLDSHMSELRFRRRNQWIGDWRKARYSDGSSVVNRNSALN